MGQYSCKKVVTNLDDFAVDGHVYQFSSTFVCFDLLQAVAQQLCENQLGEAGSPLRVQPDQDLGVQSLVCLLTHLRLALRPGANGSHLLNPLCALVFQPANMTVRNSEFIVASQSFHLSIEINFFSKGKLLPHLGSLLLFLLFCCCFCKIGTRFSFGRGQN